jgi:hypothetical protein
MSIEDRSNFHDYFLANLYDSLVCSFSNSLRDRFYFEEGRRSMIDRIVLVFVVVVHFILVILNVCSLFILPFSGLSLWITVPIETYLVNLLFTNTPCTLTNLENRLRRRLGMKEIRGYVGHYLIKNYFRVKIKVRKWLNSS